MTEAQMIEGLKHTRIVWDRRNETFYNAAQVLPEIIDTPRQKPLRALEGCELSIATLREKHLSLSEIGAACRRHFGVTFEEFKGPRQHKRVCQCRFAYYHIAHKHTDKSLHQIAAMCRRYDHSTIINGLKKVQLYMEAYAYDVLTIEQSLGVAE